MGRIYALPPGADFPRAFLLGLKARLIAAPPEALARTLVFVNTERMRRRLVTLFTESGAGFLPRLRLVTEVEAEFPLPDLPPEPSRLSRRLDLLALLGPLLEKSPDLAPHSALFDLASSLSDLMEEMQGEGVPPQSLASLDLSAHAEHWKRARAFLEIAENYHTARGALWGEARRRHVLTVLAERWRETPPDHPVIVAGSTGSRGTTALLMEAVARLPQGALVLPGFDFDLPPAIWAQMDDPLVYEDHPQFRFARLLQNLGQAASDVRPWHDSGAPDPARGRVLSLALRPAPVTDQWRSEGQALTGLPTALRNVTLVEAESPREEAQTLAALMRAGLEVPGQRVALVTPSRQLARRVSAALARWGLWPDDSGGEPLALSPPGRLVRQIAALWGGAPRSADLIALMKHPLVAAGGGEGARGAHLRLVRGYEMALREAGLPAASAPTLTAYAKGQEGAGDWALWAAQNLAALAAAPAQSLAAHLAALRALAEALVSGPAPQAEGAAPLWQGESGAALAQAFTDLAAAGQSAETGIFTPGEFRQILDGALADYALRPPQRPHPRLFIWGTLEARVQGADLVLLGGLNEGTWPESPAPDPWLNRKMRRDLGLLLPERKIGLSAHDFQQAAAAPRVVLSRATRGGEAPEVPARWLSRLLNLLEGLPAQGGPEALTDMRARGATWLSAARALDRPAQSLPPAQRPAPAPPLAARPKRLSVTRIEWLLRDPYAVYARDILRLKPLPPLADQPSARQSGILLHAIAESWGRALAESGGRGLAPATLTQLAEDILRENAPFPAFRPFWLKRLAPLAASFTAPRDPARGTPRLIEATASQDFPEWGLTLTGRADRIDEDGQGGLWLIDYKSGQPPSPAQQKTFAMQLQILALMATRGAFAPLGPFTPAGGTYQHLARSPKDRSADLGAEALAEVAARLARHFTRYQDPAQGYTALRALFREEDAGDYAHLARFGEWALSDLPAHEEVGG